LESKGYEPVVLVFNAFKPWLYRILDHNLPKLAGEKISRINITYAPFNTTGENLELEHRWLHELFPWQRL